MKAFALLLPPSPSFYLSLCLYLYLYLSLSPSLSLSLSLSLFLFFSFLFFQGAEPAFSNHTANYTGMLDYIFYSTNSFRPTAVALLPDATATAYQQGKGSGSKGDSSTGTSTGKATESKGNSNSFLPNPRTGSDHLALCCDFTCELWL